MSARSSRADVAEQTAEELDRHEAIAPEASPLRAANATGTTGTETAAEQKKEKEMVQS